jgi:tetratricopeptide (TPR) repeat protein
MKQAFSREEVRRLLRVSEKQLKAWESQKFVAPTPAYGFGELLALRSLVELKKNRVPPAQIRRVLAALSTKLSGIGNPLTQLKLYADGKKVRVDLEGRAMEAESGQLLLDFGPRELNRLLEFKVKESPKLQQDRRAEAERWFEKGLDLEQRGAPASEVIAAYEKAIELDSRSAGAYVNLGTLYFNARSWSLAERYYKKAIEADPDYALAHFNVANLYDEKGEHKKALEHYLIALRSSPNYADAHFNIALLYQTLSQPMKAVRHWTEYLKLDPSSHWATIAKRELRKIRRSTVVEGSKEEHGTA